MSSLVNSFSIIHRQSAIMLDRQLKALDISVGQFMYILYICQHEGASQEQMATVMRIDKGAIARTTKQLLDGGYITREVAEEDRRQYRIYPTDKARKIQQEMVEISAEWENRLTSALTDIEADILRSLLEKVVTTLK